MVRIDPDVITCPVHGVDLTPQVLERLRAPKSDTAYGGRSIGRTSGKKPFTFTVVCSGDDAPESAHPQVCEGQYWT
jgi:hypothetical protein